MKKVFYCISILSLIAVSCNAERGVVDKFESTKTIEMIDFDNAFKSLGDPANKPKCRREKKWFG